MDVGAIEVAFFVLAGLAVLAIAGSLLGARSFGRSARESLRWCWTAFAPRVLLLVPCRGSDPGLGANLAAILDQRGIDVRAVFVVDSDVDPAAPVIRSAIAAHPDSRAALVVADRRAGYSGKAAALLRGLQERRPGDEVVAFVDADIRPPPTWLRTLVQPLADPRVALATGYRWYVPTRGGMASVVRAAWNAVGLNIFFDDRYNFAWGGATATRSETLDAIDPAARWRGTLSEDLALTQAAKANGRAVAFVASAIAPTFEDCTWRELAAWSTRQTAMVAVWGQHIGRYAALAYAVVNGITVLGYVALALGLSGDPVLLAPAAAFLLNVPATAAKNALRARSVFFANPDLLSAWRVPRWTWALASLVVPWLVAYNLARASRLREVEWRGRTYRISRGMVVLDGPET